MRFFSTGDRVLQAQYGTGTVTAANEYHTTIDFDEHGRRTFSTRLVSLSATNEPAPNKAPARKRAVKKKKES